jgi:Leucine-rich repeat (LRR) protein
VPTSLNFKVFKKLTLLDLSSNNLTEFPLCVKDCPKLKIFRVIQNKIKEIPVDFLKNENMQENLEEFNINSNPISELSPNIKLLQKLVVLGISYTQIEVIPPIITSLENLKSLHCYGAPLREPKSIIA